MAANSDNARILSQLEEEKRSLERDLEINEDVLAYYIGYVERLHEDLMDASHKLANTDDDSVERRIYSERHTLLDDELHRVLQNEEDAKQLVRNLKSQIMEKTNQISDVKKSIEKM